MKVKLVHLIPLFAMLGCGERPPPPVTPGWRANQYDRDHAPLIRQMKVKKIVVSGPGLNLPMNSKGESRRTEISDPHLIELVLSAFEASEMKVGAVSNTLETDTSYIFIVEHNNPENNIHLTFLASKVEETKGKAMAAAHKALVDAVKEMSQ